MAMSEQEKEQYLKEITPKIEAAVDRVFLKYTGRTYRPNERMTRPSEKNGDSFQQITHDFEALFADD
jgi:hypothetical protein